MHKEIIFTIVLSLLFVNICFSQKNVAPILLPNFPLLIDSGGILSTPHSTLLADFDNDGTLEIAITQAHANTFYRKVHIIKFDGTYLSGWPKQFTYSAGSLAAGDVDGNGNVDLVFLGESLYVFNSNGNIFHGFPVSIKIGEQYASNIVINDLNHDGMLELITSIGNSLYIYNYLGQIQQGWPQTFFGNYSGKITVGDLNRDGFAEIVVPSNNTNSIDSSWLTIFQYDGTTFSGWPVLLDSNYYMSTLQEPMILYQDSLHPLIIMNSTQGYGLGYRKNRLSVFNQHGLLIHQWLTSEGDAIFESGISVADFGNNNTLELVTMSNLITISSVDGYVMQTNNMVIGGIAQHATIGRLELDEFLSVSGIDNSMMNDSGKFYVYRFDGTPLSWSPMEVYGFVDKILLGDINNDGNIEIITSSNYPFGISKSYLYVWTLPEISSDKKYFPWPMYGHDRYRTSQYGFVPNDIVNVPSFTENKINFSLAQNYPNPFNPQTVIGFSIPLTPFTRGNNALVTLKVYNLLGEEVATLINNETMQAGRHEVQFDGSKLTSGIYFYRLNVDGKFSETKKFVLMK